MTGCVDEMLGDEFGLLDYPLCRRILHHAVVDFRIVYISNTRRYYIMIYPDVLEATQIQGFW